MCGKSKYIYELIYQNILTYCRWFVLSSIQKINKIKNQVGRAFSGKLKVPFFQSAFGFFKNYEQPGSRQNPKLLKKNSSSDILVENPFVFV